MVCGCVAAVADICFAFYARSACPDGELEVLARVVPWDEISWSPAPCLSFRSPTGTTDTVLALVERIVLHGVSYAVGFTAWLDINPEGVSKASALELVRRRLAVEPGQTIAVGDQRNDIEMLRWAARGVAMGNAPDEVKASADEVTQDVDQDGLVPILRSLLTRP